MKPSGGLRRGPWEPTERTIRKHREWRDRSRLAAAAERQRPHPYRPPVHTPTPVLDLVIARSLRPVRLTPDGMPGGLCEVCGQQPGTNTHTRRPGGMGGTRRDSTRAAANKIRVCGHGNVTGCHGRIENERGWARETGLLVAQGSDPEHVAADLWHGTVLLDQRGHYRSERS